MASGAPLATFIQTMVQADMPHDEGLQLRTLPACQQRLASDASRGMRIRVDEGYMHSTIFGY